MAGAIELDEQDPSRSTVEVRIDPASIDTQVADRDTHLKSADFLDVTKYPGAHLPLGERHREGRRRARRDRRPRGCTASTREVALEAEFAGSGKDPWGNTRAGFSAKASLDRRDYGLVWNAALETGRRAGRRGGEITLELEAVKKVATAAAAAA